MSGPQDDRVSALLQRRVRTDGSTPLITYYQPATGERTELSAISFANWVAKTSNFLLDEVGVEPGDPIAVDLLLDHPGHWVTAIWIAACWQTGSVVVVPDRDGATSAEAVLEVIGPERIGAAESATDRVACRLHPLGLGFADPLPPGVLDFSSEVRTQPDQFFGAPVDPDGLAWLDGATRRTQADLVRPASPPTARARRLVVPTDPWTAIRQVVIEPLVGGGSAVVVVGATPDQLSRIATEERVTPDRA